MNFARAILFNPATGRYELRRGDEAHLLDTPGRYTVVTTSEDEAALYGVWGQLETKMYREAMMCGT